MTKKNSLFLILILILAFVLRVPLFNVPPDFDEGCYAFFAFFSKGEKFYSSLPIGRLPGMIFTYRALDYLFARDMLAVRVACTFLIVLATFGVYKLGELLFNKKTGFFSAIIFALFSSLISTESPTNSEFFMMPFIVMAFWLFWLFQKSKKFLWLALSGFFAGIALIYKQVAVFEVIFLGLWLLAENFKEGKFKIKSLVKQLLFLGVPSLLPFLFVLLFFLLRGEFKDFWWQSFGSGGGYWRYAWSGGEWLGRLKIAFKNLWSDFMPFWLVGSLGLIYAFFKRKKEEIYLVGWIAFALMGACFNGWFFSHYFVQIIPTLSLLGGLFLSIFLEWIRFKSRLPIVISKIISIFILLGLFFLMEKKKLPSYLSYLQMAEGKISETEYIEKIGYDVGPAGWLSFYQSADYLREKMKKDESLFTWSTFPLSYYLIGKYPTTSFVHIYPLLDYKLMLDTAKGWKYDFENNRKKLMEELTSNFPDYIILQIEPGQIFDQMAIFGSFSNFVVDNYVFNRQFGNVLVYKREQGKVPLGNNIAVPLEAVKRYSAITNIKVNEGRMEVDFEPMVNPNGVLRSFKSIYPYLEEIKFVPLSVQSVGIGKEDFVGYGFIKPSGIPDLHFRVKGLPKQTSFIRVKVGNFAWNSQSYGVNPIIKVIQNNDIFDLYMEPVNIGNERKIEVYFIYNDGSLSLAKININ